MNVVLNAIIFLAGLILLGRTLFSALRVFVLPRAAWDKLASVIFSSMRRIFNFIIKKLNGYERKDAVMAYYAPVTLVAVPAYYLGLVALSFTAMFWAVGVRPLYSAFLLSGSSLLTLGFAQVDTLGQMLLAFAEATTGLILIATLIAYLPTMYAAFSTREKMVSMLEVRAGSPPSAAEMYARFVRLDRLGEIDQLWVDWEHWFSDLDESHTSLAALVFFRSPQPHNSWITAAGAVLDGAALRASVIDLPRDVNAEICIRAGYLALNHIATFFRVNVADLATQDEALAVSISVTREAFDAMCADLHAAGVPLKPDRDQAWRDFYGWRANYDASLVALADLVMAPPGIWTG